MNGERHKRSVRKGIQKWGSGEEVLGNDITGRRDLGGGPTL